MSQVSVTTTDTITVLASPYNPDLPSEAKAIGGRWNPADRTWVFDARDEARVRDLATTIYGTDGSDADAAGVTVRVPLNGQMEGYHGKDNGIIRLAGRELVRRAGRDERVRLAANVVVVEGEFATYGGSVRWPQIGDVDGVVIEVRDLPPAVADRMMTEAPGATIVGAVEEQIAALRAERDALVARIAEIDARIADATA